MATVVSSRGPDIHIVEHLSKYYLINLRAKKVILADPPDIPDMFLKFGYFEGPIENKTIRLNAEAEFLLWLNKNT